MAWMKFPKQWKHYLAIKQSDIVGSLASVINCNTRHAGQIEYLRGLVKYRDWFLAAE